MLSVVRSINLLLGVWLVISAFLWTHSHEQFGNTCAVGVASAVVAALAMGSPRLRWINGVVALWLFVSAFVLPHATVGTIWNGVIVAVIMFSVSVAETMGPIESDRSQRKTEC